MAKVVELAVEGESKTLRERPAAMREHAPESPQLLLLMIDGVSRDLLYAMLRGGKLPNLAALLGDAELEHAYFDDSYLATLPSSTMAGWVTALTGVPPAVHGVVDNEYFVRETATLECPAPVSFNDLAPTLELYTDGYLGSLVATPTMFERLRAQHPSALFWVAMHPLFRGADKLITTKRSLIAEAAESFTTGQGTSSHKLYAAVDEATLAAVTSQLAKGTMPDVLAIYLPGADLHAHVAPEGPDDARRAYLRDVIDPKLGPLVARLRARNALSNRWVIVTSDHGHTEVLHDQQHALHEAPAQVLRRAGFRLRPFKRRVGDVMFDAVIASGGAMAHVYVADRSRCTDRSCVWKLPPRYNEDVLAAAEAFHRANTNGKHMREMKGTLDFVLVRRPKPFAEVDAPFEVYTGNGKTETVEAYLRAHPHPTYVAFEARLRALAVGPHGERAGDVLLLAHNGDRTSPADRYYFAPRYRSWHGSPSRDDSELPLIVAHPRHRAATIGRWVRNVFGDQPFQQKLTELVLALRGARIR